MLAFLGSIGYERWTLPALLLIPTVGALVIWIHGAFRQSETGDEVTSGAAAIPRNIALWTFIVEFVVSIGLWWSYNPGVLSWQSAVNLPWIPTWGIRFTIGIDGIAVMMVLLTT